jgi:hypothetical protein
MTNKLGPAAVLAEPTMHDLHVLCRKWNCGFSAARRMFALKAELTQQTAKDTRLLKYAQSEILSLAADLGQQTARVEALSNAVTVAIVALAHYNTSDNELDNVRVMLEAALAAGEESNA